MLTVGPSAEESHFSFSIHGHIRKDETGPGQSSLTTKTTARLGAAGKQNGIDYFTVGKKNGRNQISRLLSTISCPRFVSVSNKTIHVHIEQSETSLAGTSLYRDASTLHDGAT